MVFKFSVDDLFDNHLPPSQLYKFPRVLSFFLGYHKPPHKPANDYWIWLEILIGSFCGLSLIMGIFKSPNIFSEYHHAPIILASYGASAILCFNASQVPLAQPRNVLVGHFLSACIGMGIQKLFYLSEGGRDHMWASAAISVSISSVIMSICNCIHPPAGASAILPSIDEQVRLMSWWYLPVQLISSSLIITVACITGNIVRSYPVYWWSAGAGLEQKKQRMAKLTASDEETKIDSNEEIDKSGKEKEEVDNSSNSDDMLYHPETNNLIPVRTNETGINRYKNENKIIITSTSISVPENLDLEEVERDFLLSIQSKLFDLNSETLSRTHTRKSSH
ncbi:uncharacterized protein KGF55_004308 [Candida pseudojiufengensis]|uniref:uncharacterized protein n=1 Tax=Candida pseudojiufengensis TaxID=497109 RepID=UPI0022253040|nr:uncharacterized protein KGF55_004308 [Candida pseudojiufengensis]KAI5960738.1 hypothetical protein KGF55_004308 [Candida pseudojiufengensis]